MNNAHCAFFFRDMKWCHHLFVLLFGLNGKIIHGLLSFTETSLASSRKKIGRSHNRKRFHHFVLKVAPHHASCSNNTEESTINLSLAESRLDVTGVTLKMAFDTSYAVADASEDKSERFTCSQSLDLVHKLRRWSDAVLVGRSTVQIDNCTLTVRRVPLLPSGKKQPARIVIACINSKN